MLSTRPEKSVGTDDIWDLATEGLKGALERKGWDYTVRLGQHSVTVRVHVTVRVRGLTGKAQKQGVGAHGKGLSLASGVVKIVGLEGRVQ